MRKRFTTIIAAILLMIMVIPVDSAYAVTYQDGSKTNTFNLKINQWLYVDALNYDTFDNAYGSYYFKFKATKTGWVKVYLESDKDSGYEEGADFASLCNSKKKRITNEFYYYDDYREKNKTRPGFGVKKGKTYYIKLRGTADGFRIKITTGAYSGTYGKTKKKAVNIKPKTTKKGVFIAGEKDSPKWYKIKIKKRSKPNLKILFRHNIDDEMDIRFYNSKGKNVTSAFVRNKKVPKGTYYAKVYKRGLTSGVFYIKRK